MTRFHPARLPALPVLAVAWASYAAFLVAVFPATPLAVLAMVVPLLLAGWYARHAAVPAIVGLGHGAVLAAVGWQVGAFDSWPGGGAGLALAAALLMLLSWFTAVAGHTVRVMQLLRSRTSELQTARLEMDADRASVEAIYEATAAGLIAISHDGAVRSWNLGARQIFGYQPQQIMGLDIQRLGAVGDPDDCMGRIRYAMAAQHALDTLDARMRNAHGDLLDVEVRGQPVIHPDGDPGFILTIVDRTRERRMERELRAQAALQDRMLRNLDDVIYSVAVPSRDVLLMTRNVEKLVGLDADEITKFDTLVELAHPDDREEVKKRWEHARAGDQSSLRWRIRRDDGSHTWVEDHAVPARDDEGRVVRVDSIMRRVGRDLELERQAQRMMRWLDAMEPMTGGGAWSLDLRDGQWSWSSGMHRILGTSPSEEDLHAWCDRMHERSAERLQRLVDNPAELPGPVRIHIHDGQQQRPFVMECWLQRGADGEPIWLYGIIRPVHAHGRPKTLAPAAGTKNATADAAEHAAGPVVQQLEPPRPAGAEERILQALERSREAVEAARLAAPAFPPTGWDRHEAVAVLGVAPCDAIAHQITQDIGAASHWARERRVAIATSPHALMEPVTEAVREWSDETVHGLRDAILAAERQAIERASQSALLAAQEAKQAALAEAENVKQAALAAAEQARQEATQEVARAHEAAAAHARHAKEAHAARLRAEEAQAEADARREQALREVESTKAEALELVKQTRAQALRDAESARADAEREAVRAREAEAARAKAEAARAQALKEAEEAKAKSLQEAGQARAEALQQAAAAKKRAQAIAAEAAKAQRLRDEAEQAKLAAVAAAKEAQQRAVQEAEEAKAHVLKEAERTTAHVMEQFRQAEQAAKREAAKARAAEQARAEAQSAAKQAQAAAQEAKKQAQRDAEAATKKALAEADAAREAALEEARRATAAALAAAEQARTEAVQAARRAQDAAKQEQAKSRRAEQAMARAVQEAEQAKAAAVAKAEATKTAAVAEAKQAMAARDEALQEAEAAQRRFEEAEVRAAAELEALRRQVDKEPFRVTGPSFQPVPTGQKPMSENEVEMEVAWDDEVGWVPRPKKQDTAEQIKAKSWSDDKPGKVKGPWALD